MARSKKQSILMANNNSMEGFVSNKKPKICASDYETIQHSRPLVSIDYIRVRDEQEVNGTVIVRDCCGEDIAYLQYMGGPAVVGGEYISLCGPSRPICGAHKFVINFYLWARAFVNFEMKPREIGKGAIVWDPKTQDHSSYDKPIQQDVGRVRVGYSVFRHALSATVQVAVVGKSKAAAKIDGTIKASTVLGSPRMLFDSSRTGSLYLYQQKNILPLARPFLAVPVDSCLTIAVHLWHDDDNQIALDSVEFTPMLGTHEKNITTCNGNFGEMQVSVTWE